MKTMLLAAAAMIGVTILSANLFVVQSNASQVLPKYTGTAVLRLTAGRNTCWDDANKICAAQCKSTSNNCFVTCRNQMNEECPAGG